MTNCGSSHSNEHSVLYLFKASPQREAIMAEEENLTLESTLGEKKIDKLSWMQKLTLKLKLTEKGATPPNWKYIGLVFAALFSSASTLTFLFPFLPEMILTFGYSENEKGTVGTAKAVIYDISDNSNQAVSMSMLSISWGLGMVVGPTIGGLLADPVKKWPSVFSADGLFGEYPYLLASLFPFISCFLIFFLIFFKFENTFDESVGKRRESVVVTVPDSLEAQENANEQDESKKDSYAPLLKPHHDSSQMYLGQSINSLHMEAAQTSAFFAHEMFRKRQNKPNSVSSKKSKKLNPHSIFVSVPNLTEPGSPVMPEPSFGLFLSTPDIANAPSKTNSVLLSRRTNSFGNHHDLKLKSNAYVRQNSQGVNGNGAVVHTELQDNADVTVLPVEEISPVDTGPVVTEDDVGNLNSNGLLKLEEDGNTSIEEDENKICKCMELTCSSACCTPCRSSSLYRLFRLKNVWASIMLYVIYSFVIIGVEDIFPVFASTQIDYGGLGFSTDEIGLAIGATFLPLLFLQIKLYPFLVSKLGIIKVFQFCAIGCMVTSQIIPCVRLLNNSPVWLWICLMVVQVPFKIFTNCCFAGSALLINNSVTQDLAGQANGLAMMATAIGRTIAPTVAGSLFSWSVTYGPAIGIPFDTSFPFFILGLIFVISVIECLGLDPSLDQQGK
ncbi:protein zinc INDUCED FACILITATOR-LIKE 1 [Elysia marginata]|uniref:Protein zinc INDUCED FACILITATOR-LIKE 1 n=1 Tax=Elysia marginata TaxID=1093978 RepID=A0AAV4I0A2_9GAST|nr:protein zinc INDUCED FACILITATOR-LIKE 1 [Elysia marginata]